MTTVFLLKTHDGTESNLTETLANKPAFVIGSDSRADFRLTNRDVQPAHAVITQRGSDYYVAPRLPTAEVRLNGKAVRVPTRLTVNDTLQLGTAALTLEQAEVEAPLAPLAPKLAVLTAAYVAPVALTPLAVTSAATTIAVSQPREIYFPKSESSGGLTITGFVAGLFTLLVAAFVIGYGFVSSTSSVTAADITSRYAFGDGHVTVVMFEASWCTFCKEQKPILNDLATDYRGKVYNQYLDAEAPVNVDMVKAFNVSAYPVTVVFNDQGQVSAKFLGLTDARSIRLAIDQALRESGQPI